MAQFKPYKITSEQLDSLPITEGQLIFLTDTAQIFLDTSSTTRTEICAAETSSGGTTVTVSTTEPSDLSTGDIWMVLEEEEQRIIFQIILLFYWWTKIFNNFKEKMMFLQI